MADKDNIGGDAHGFDNIDSSDSAFDGDNSDFEGDGGFREYNGAGFEFDGDGGGGGDDFGVFDFCEGDDQPHATMSIPHVDDEPRDAPSIETFSVVEDLRQTRHGDFVVMNPTTNKVEPFHSTSDSLDFGDAGKGGNFGDAHQSSALSRALYSLISKLPSNSQHSKLKRYWPHIAYGTCCSI